MSAIRKIKRKVKGSDKFLRRTLSSAISEIDQYYKKCDCLNDTPANSVLSGIIKKYNSIWLDRCKADGTDHIAQVRNLFVAYMMKIRKDQVTNDTTAQTDKK